jgi:transcriptional regulator NrdR family protein
MNCPQCGGKNTRCVSTFHVQLCPETVRRRKCQDCEYRWYSVQRPEELIPGHKVIFKRPFQGNVIVERILS